MASIRGASGSSVKASVSPKIEVQIGAQTGESLRGDDADARSPEHMVLTSLGLGLLATFEACAERHGIELLACRADVTGVVEQSIDGPTFASIVVGLDVEIDGNVESFEDALEDAKRYCLVLNALRVPVIVETTVQTPYESSLDLADVADLAEITELRPRSVELLTQLQAM